MSKILIIGASGQLGSAIMNAQYDYPEYSIIGLTSKDIDIRNKDSINQSLDKNKPNYVINTAAYTDVVNAEKNPSEAFELNAIAVNTLSNACIDRNISLLHISTDYVFGSHQMKVLQEFTEVNPLQVYGASKLAGEIIVKNLFTLNKLPWQIIRLSFLYGIQENTSKGTFLLRMLKKLHQGEKIKLTTDSYMSPTNADDASNFILQNIYNKSDIYHGTNTGASTPYEFIVAATKKMNSLGSKLDLKNILPVSYKDFADTVNRPKFSYIGTCHKNIYKMSDWHTSLDKFIVKNYKKIVEGL